MGNRKILEQFSNIEAFCWGSEGAEMGDVVSADVDVDVLEVGAVVDNVEARPGESVDANVAVVISHVNCLNGATDGQDFPFIRDGIVGVIAGKDPNNLHIMHLPYPVLYGQRRVKFVHV